MLNNPAANPQVLEFLRTRRSHPSLTMAAPGPDDDLLHQLLTIAARVPDHGKLAPWRFIVYRAGQGERIGAYLAERYEALNGTLDAAQKDKERTRFLRAPLVVGVLSCAGDHPKIPVWEQQMSAGAVCMNLVTAAAASGFVSQWLTEWFAFDGPAASFLGARKGERFAGFIHIGTPTQAPVERPRPVVAELTSTWTEKD